MLFNSYIFIFVFLPSVLLVFNVLGRYKQFQLARVWLVVASLFFYGWLIPEYVPLVIASLVFNHTMGIIIGRNRRRLWLWLGVSVNLGILGYYKYFNFFLANLHAFFGTPLFVEQIILPLGISFFTFQQVAYLVDTYRCDIPECQFIDYCLFITFFPQWVAGPIVLYQQTLPQISNPSFFRFHRSNIESGLSLFVIGLVKKVILADGISPYSTRVFDLALTAPSLNFFDAWCGVLSYTFQIYFDFSGYSDMAVGLGNMFNVRFPANFSSPYKAASLIDFWQRWHITLSGFLKNYLYIPLGGNRHGKARRYGNLFLTMILGGLWHGAGWNFLIWGGLHGVYLSINHFWRDFRKGTGSVSSFFPRWGSRSLTFFLVVVTWTFFRATNFSSAVSMLRAMSGMNGVIFPRGYSAYLTMGIWGKDLGMSFGEGPEIFSMTAMGWILVLACISWFLPNSQEWMSRRQMTWEIVELPGDSGWRPILWKPTVGHGILLGVLAGISILALSRVSEFLYFQF